MEFKFDFPLGCSPEARGSPETGDRPEPAVAQRPLREHVAGELAGLGALLDRGAVSVLKAGGLRIRHIEPSALLLGGRVEGEGSGPKDEAEGLGSKGNVEGLGPNGEVVGSGPDGERSGPAGEGSGPAGEGSGPDGEGSGPAGEGSGPAGEGSGPAGEGSESRPEKERLSWDLLSHSDLLPGVYEGGLKIWECTVDLVEYMAGIDLQGLKVLDLGCGAGLVGIAALIKGAACVHFQDYNSEVLEQLTIPNVALSKAEPGHSLPGTNQDSDLEENDEPPGKRSRAEGSPLSRCCFFSGPWSLFGQVHTDRGASLKYDVILSSETLYCQKSYAALHHALSSLLSDQGTIYLATKAHYFGVGGGIHLFQKFVEEKQIFDIRTVKVIDDGLQRCIALMSFRRGKSS
ncbi:histidine protein methyltransferase 1 homolog isoform X2 [Leucoraja erinacea]|uniref:histidine protein methyltransferase 1 homolog isoform X2 n=1 Tax=Leucoraja erinaceus TaxID=7782 RepID=UPI002457E200|nr:histidine protein methyltransferase 1 homolog isoform X2 [Leucoraja erinacea]